MKLEEPYRFASVHDVVQQWRDLAGAALELDAYGPPADAPRRLHPKSPAWRSFQAQARRLRPYERQDLQTIVSVCDEWLASDDGAARVTVTQAMEFAQAFARVHSALLSRVWEPDKQDAATLRQRERGARQGGRKGAEAVRKVTVAQAEEVVRGVQTERPELSWSRTCSEAAKQLKVSASRVRHLLPKSPLRPPKA